MHREVEVPCLQKVAHAQQQLRLIERLGEEMQGAETEHLELHPYGLVKLMSALMDEPLDQGSHKFDPSNLEFTSIDIGNPTVNLIPGEARARFNIRFNDCHDYASLKALVEQRAKKAAGDKVKWTIDWEPSNADVFYTEPSPFTDVVVGAVAEVTGKTPKLSTSGGTSDARFIKDYCPVVEFGLVGQTMHKVDEHVAVADVEGLARIYGRVIADYFGG